MLLDERGPVTLDQCLVVGNAAGDGREDLLALLSRHELDGLPRRIKRCGVEDHKPFGPATVRAVLVLLLGHEHYVKVDGGALVTHLLRHHLREPPRPLILHGRLTRIDTTGARVQVGGLRADGHAVVEVAGDLLDDVHNGGLIELRRLRVD